MILKKKGTRVYKKVNCVKGPLKENVEARKCCCFVFLVSVWFVCFFTSFCLLQNPRERERERERVEFLDYLFVYLFLYDFD